LLVLGHEQDNFTQPSYHILRELGLPTRQLTQQECATHFPQFVTHDYDFCTYNAEAAILHASDCLHTLKEQILLLGGTIYENSKVTHLFHDHAQRPIQLQLASGDELLTERVVLAIGPWLHQLLGPLRLPVRMTRQYLLYFSPLSPDDFNHHVFPAFFAHDLYGFPLHNNHKNQGPTWLKVASHAFGVSADPDAHHPVEEQVIAQLQRRIGELLPALRNAPLAHIESSMYDVTGDEHFILDTLPDDPRIVIGTGFSGHGFKFGPLIGEILSSLVRDEEPPVSLQRFQLARFARVRETVGA
jgi:glycine/D-amino acid oxidase-like deaminating enzyme